MTVIEYEREFVRLSKYTEEYVSIEEIMCKRFVDGLNKDIKLLVEILDLKEFVVLVDRACDLRPEYLLELNTICAREEASSPDVITGTFSLYDTNVIALIDPGPTHSYIYINLVSNKSLPIESTKFVIKVSNPLCKYVLVDKACMNYPLMTRDYYFLADLMLLPFYEFDVILGMDWLTLHDAIVNCRRKIIELKSQRCVRKGCEAYLAYVLETKVSESKIESVPVVYEYSNVFPEELLGSPPIKEVEFAI
ncbi:RVP_2 domain-containing protein [Gossypium australe]|uniref:RVP_2 domain-containing protein n=1 Tax=Gossypium australe TaxID=47621 RepID=A0A5B6WPH1_9ROSI|nr:RVP_2 domain-containing protein [Gossypium australe]